MPIRRTILAFSLFAAFVLLSVAPAASAADSVVRPGNWQISFQMDIPGLPVKMKPITVTQCVTEEDAADPNKSLPSQSRDENCKVVDHKVEGNKVSWSVKCDGQEEVATTGELTFGTDSYDGVVRVNSGGQQMTSKIKGKRLGDCTR